MKKNPAQFILNNDNLTIFIKINYRSTYENAYKKSFTEEKAQYILFDCRNFF